MKCNCDDALGQFCNLCHPLGCPSCAELQRRLDAIVTALKPGPMPLEGQFKFNLNPRSDFKHAHDKWTARRQIHANIKAIAEGKS